MKAKAVKAKTIKNEEIKVDLTPISNENQASLIVNERSIMKNSKMRKAIRIDKKKNRNFFFDRKVRGKIKKPIIKVTTLIDEEVIDIDLKSKDKMQELVQDDALTFDLLLSKVKDANLTGMSGNCTPTYKKLEAFYNNKKIEYNIVIINAMECEPGLMTDSFLLKNEKEVIKRGVKILQKVFTATKFVLATKGVENFKNACDILPSALRLSSRYPLGEERKLVQEILDFDLRPDEYSTSCGILVLNLQTVYQISRIMDGTFDRGRYITLANLNEGRSKIAYVKEGEDARSKLEKAFEIKNSKVYLGGGVLYSRQMKENEKITLDTCFIGLIDEKKIAKFENKKCIGCGRCTRNCPQNIEVANIVKLRQKDMNADIKMLNSSNCIHCGICAYYCPRGIMPFTYMG